MPHQPIVIRCNVSARRENVKVVISLLVLDVRLEVRLEVRLLVYDIH